MLQQLRPDLGAMLFQAPLFCLVPPTEMRKPPRPIARRIDGVGKSPSGMSLDKDRPTLQVSQLSNRSHM